VVGVEKTVKKAAVMAKKRQRKAHLCGAAKPFSEFEFQYRRLGIENSGPFFGLLQEKEA
jgi:hypothetical protein